MTKLLSASRLNGFQSCPHQAALWLQGVKPPVRADDAVRLIRDKGFEHEAEVLAGLKAGHGECIEIPTDGSPAERASVAG